MNDKLTMKWLFWWLLIKIHAVKIQSNAKDE